MVSNPGTAVTTVRFRPTATCTCNRLPPERDWEQGTCTYTHTHTHTHTLPVPDGYGDMGTTGTADPTGLCLQGVDTPWLPTHQRPAQSLRYQSAPPPLPLPNFISFDVVIHWNIQFTLISLKVTSSTLPFTY